MKEDEMRRSQEKELYIKITEYIGKVFDNMISSKAWTAKEISHTLKIDNARITNYRKGDRPITKATLAKMIQMGMVTMDEIKEHVDFSKEELAYLTEHYGLLNDIGASKAYIRLKQAGVDPEKVMVDFLEKLEKR